MRGVNLAALLAAALVVGCGSGAERPPDAAAGDGRPPHDRARDGAAGRGGAAGASRRDGRRPARTLVPVRCATGATNCAAVTGRVLAVQAVDPDGDGDAHFVVLGGGITVPGITVIDVEAPLRPSRLPRAGDRVSAAGPVFAGSYGQRQIQAVTLHYQRSR